MRAHNRSRKKQEAQEQVDIEYNSEWVDWWDNWRDYYKEEYRHRTVDDVRRGWLMQLLIKLNLKSPRKQIIKLNW